MVLGIHLGLAPSASLSTNRGRQVRILGARWSVDRLPGCTHLPLPWWDANAMRRAHQEQYAVDSLRDQCAFGFRMIQKLCPAAERMGTCW